MKSDLVNLKLEALVISGTVLHKAFMNEILIIRDYNDSKSLFVRKIVCKNCRRVHADLFVIICDIIRYQARRKLFLGGFLDRSPYSIDHHFRMIYSGDHVTTNLQCQSKLALLQNACQTSACTLYFSRSLVVSCLGCKRVVFTRFARDH